MRVWWFSVFLVGVLALSGCSDKVEPVTRVPVKGSVKVDGEPLMTGHITFDAQNGQPPSTMDILDGHFEGTAAVGKNKVMITSIKKMTTRELHSGNKNLPQDGPGYDDLVEVNFLPPRYNDKSEIVREVTEGGDNTFDFNNLKSK